jgi:hypothetical protein
MSPVAITPHKTYAPLRAARPLVWLLAALVLYPVAVWAQPTPAPQASSQITDAQAALYERWRANVRLNQRTAYDAGKEYLAKYPADEYAAYVRPWVEFYERAARKARFQQLLYKEKNYSAAYAAGRLVLADEPESVKTHIDLASAAYLATGAGDETVRADALALARKSLELLDGDKRASDWQPFAGPADAAAYLNFVIGDLTLKDDPAAAVAYLRKAALAEAAIKNTPTVYARLATAYARSEYEPLARDFATRYAGKETTPESQAALAQIYPVLDRMIDAYARAVALSQSDPQYTTQRPRWQQDLTEFYKTRHNGSTEGLNTLIADVVNTPLPDPNKP